MSWPADRNFDDLAHRFKRNVYDRLKGDIRLAVLNRDLMEFMPWLEPDHPNYRPLDILDAGGGQGQFSQTLAKKGHKVLLCDISEEMLTLADESIRANGLEHQISTQLTSVQSLAAESERKFDVVLCHAVLEWVSNPDSFMQSLSSLVRPDGILSLTFYNVNGTILKNLLRTNFQKVVEGDYRGYRGSLTPTYPREPKIVRSWMKDNHLNILSESGIRCFHDYILDPEDRQNDPQTQVELELKLSREEPWRSLGRYIHLVGKNCSG